MFLDATADPPAAPAAPLVPAAAPSAIDLATHPAAVYLGSLAARSARTQRTALDQVAQLLGHADALACPWASLRYSHMQRLRALLKDRYAAATANRMLGAVSRVLEEAWRLDLLDRETYERAVDIAPVRGHREPAGRALDGREIEALLTACAADATPAGVRDAAIVALLYTTGMRRSEVVALDLADYTPATGAVRVRHGKGNKERIVYAAAAAQHLADWLVLRGEAAGPLFVRAHRGGGTGATRLSESGVRDLLARRGAAAGLAHFSPHDIRRTTISDLLDAGADLSAAQQLAGHADPKTTAAYDRRGERAKRKAADLLTIPRRTLDLT